MNTVDLMECIGAVDEALLIDARVPNRTGRHKLRPILAAAAIATLLLLMVGCTVVSILIDKPMMEVIFGTNGRENYASDTIKRIYYEPGGGRTELNETLAEKYIAPCIFPVDQSLLGGETTLTVLSCIADRTSCTAAIYIKMEHPPKYHVYNSGWLLFDYEKIEDIWFIHPKALGQQDVIGRCIIDSTSTTEDTLFFLFFFSCEPSCTALEVRIRDNPEAITIKLPAKTDMPSISLENGDIVITPYGMKVSASLLKQDDIPQHPERSKRELAIQFKDGSEYLLQHFGFGDEDFIGYTYGMALNMDLEHYVYIFSRVMELKDISAFRINDHIYPVK